jgi:hypothetical protein
MGERPGDISRPGQEMVLFQITFSHTKRSKSTASVLICNFLLKEGLLKKQGLPFISRKM